MLEKTDREFVVYEVNGEAMGAAVLARVPIVTFIDWWVDRNDPRLLIRGKGE